MGTNDSALSPAKYIPCCWMKGMIPSATTTRPTPTATSHSGSRRRAGTAPGRGTASRPGAADGSSCAASRTMLTTDHVNPPTAIDAGCGPRMSDIPAARGMGSSSHRPDDASRCPFRLHRVTDPPRAATGRVTSAGWGPSSAVTVPEVRPPRALITGGPAADGAVNTEVHQVGNRDATTGDRPRSAGPAHALHGTVRSGSRGPVLHRRTRGRCPGARPRHAREPHDGVDELLLRPFPRLLLAALDLGP